MTGAGLVTGILWPLAASFVGCCPSRKASYFVYTQLIMSKRSAYVCLYTSAIDLSVLLFFFLGHALSQICISR